MEKSRQSISGAKTVVKKIVIALLLGSFSVTANAQAPQLWATAQVSETQPFVQQGIVYRIQIYSTTPLSKVVPQRPEASGLALERLDDPLVQTTEQRQGRRYHVTNYHYALTPLTFGRVEVPATTVQVTPAIAPWGAPWGSGGTREETLKVPAVVLTVQPPAADLQPWLPAHSLHLEGSLQPGAKLGVGEPLSLSLHLRIEGGGAYQLPPLQSWLHSDDFKIYLEQQSVSQKVSWDDQRVFLSGERSETFTVIPRHEGELHLPAITLSAWDTLHQRPLQAQWPGSSVTIGTRTTTSPPVTNSIAENRWQGYGYWLTVGGVFVLGWLLGQWGGIRTGWQAVWSKLRHGDWRISRDLTWRLPFPSVRSLRTPLARLQQRARTTLWRLTPLPFHAATLLRTMRRQTTPQGLYRSLANFAHAHWQTSPNAPLSVLAQVLLTRYPSLPGVQVNALFERLNYALYAAAQEPFHVSSWQAEFTRLFSSLPLRLPRRVSATSGGLPKLNPLE